MIIDSQKSPLAAFIARGLGIRRFAKVEILGNGGVGGRVKWGRGGRAVCGQGQVTH